MRFLSSVHTGDKVADTVDFSADTVDFCRRLWRQIGNNLKFNSLSRWTLSPTRSTLSLMSTLLPGCWTSFRLLSAVLYGAKDLQRSRPCWIQRCRQCVPDFTFNKLYITGTSVKTGYNDEVTKRAVDTDTKLSHTRVAAMRKTWPETVVAVITLQCSKCEITTTLLQYVEGGT